jgi:hypothetical protein
MYSLQVCISLSRAEPHLGKIIMPEERPQGCSFLSLTTALAARTVFSQN